MATINYTKLELNVGIAFTWPAMAAGDDGQTIDRFDLADRSIQFSGAFSGCTMVLEGSNDGVEWQTLYDPHGVPLSFTAPALASIDPITRWVRPKRTGGTGSSVTATLFGKYSK